MSQDLSFEFFDLAMTKDLLKILQTDNEDDALLQGTIGLRAERLVTNKLTPYATTFPLDDVDDQETAISAACNFAASIYKKRNGNKDAAQDFKDAANEDINSLIVAFKARHKPRTRIAIASQSYDTEDDILFSQRIIR